VRWPRWRKSEKTQPILAEFPLIALVDGAIRAFKIPFELLLFLDFSKIKTGKCIIYDLRGRIVLPRVVAGRPLAELIEPERNRSEELRELLQTYLANFQYDTRWLKNAPLFDLIDKTLERGDAYVQAGIEYPVVTVLSSHYIGECEVFRNAEAIFNSFEEQDIIDGGYSAYDSGGHMLQLCINNSGGVVVETTKIEPRNDALTRSTMTDILLRDGADEKQIISMSMPNLMKLVIERIERSDANA